MPDSNLPPNGEFIGEPIYPLDKSMRVSDMLQGRPGVPMRFRWRGGEYAVKQVIETWKTTGPCRSGSPEQYVRAHWYRVVTEDGTEMTLYCDRQKRRGISRIEWRLYTLSAKK